MPRKASARLLYPTVSISERIAELGVKGALLFTWLFAHSDDQGRYAGSTRKVKAEVVPLLEDISVDDVDKALDDMKNTDLIIRYTDDKKRELIQIVDWWEFQHGLRFKNPSRYPPPDGWQDKVTESPLRDDRGKFKSTEESADLDERLDNIMSHGSKQEYSLDELCSISKEPREAVIKALTMLYAGGIVETRKDRGETPEPPFDGDESFYLVGNSG